MNLCKHAVQTQKDVAYRVRRAAMHVVMGEDSQKRIHSHYMVSKCIYLRMCVCWQALHSGASYRHERRCTLNM